MKVNNIPIDKVGFSYIKHGCHVAYCRICNKAATHLSSTGTYHDAYLVTEDGTYDEETNTFICWPCYGKQFQKVKLHD